MIKGATTGLFAFLLLLSAIRIYLLDFQLKSKVGSRKKSQAIGFSLRLQLIFFGAVFREDYDQFCTQTPTGIE